MAAISKTKKIESLVKLLQKRHKGLPNPPERQVLEHLIYAALLENASFEQADAAYTVLEHYFIDWNEIRVSTVNELADTFQILPDPHAAGERVRTTLQGVFEKTYMFDLEELRKKGKSLGQAVEFLDSIPGSTRFMVDYTTQVAFGGHVIPLDEASRRVFRLLDMTQVNKEGTREDVPGLERAIAKKNGLTFAVQLHHFASGFFADPDSPELRTLLKPIDPEALKRDCTPPVLTIIKPIIKPVIKPEIPPLPAVLPFAASDDDDFEEEHGTEAEFLPDTSLFHADEPTLPSDDDNDDLFAPLKPKKTAKPAVKKEVPSKKPEAPSKQVSKPADKKSSDKKTAEKKPVGKGKKTVSKNDSKKSPAKQLAKKKPK